MKAAFAALLPERRRAALRAGRDRVQRPVVARRQTHQVIDHGARVGPEAQRPPRHHAALGVPDDVDPAPVGRVHRTDRVDDVLAGDLDVAHGAARQRHGAVRPAQLRERRLPAVAVVGSGVQPGAGDEQDRFVCGARQAARAAQRRGQLGRGDAQRRARPIRRRVRSRGDGRSTAGAPRRRSTPPGTVSSGILHGRSTMPGSYRGSPRFKPGCVRSPSGGEHAAELFVLAADGQLDPIRPMPPGR